MTVLLVEQYLDFAIRLANPLVVLSRGGIVERRERGAISHADLTRHIAV